MCTSFASSESIRDCNCDSECVQQQLRTAVATPSRAATAITASIDAGGKTADFEKGPLSAYLLASVADVDYTITWIAGVRNKIADFLSRYGTEGPRQMTSAGLAAAVELLLERLGDDHRSDDTIWLYARKDTAAIGRRLQRWRHRTNALKQKLRPTSLRSQYSTDLRPQQQQLISRVASERSATPAKTNTDSYHATCNEPQRPSRLLQPQEEILSDESQQFP